MLGRRLVHVGLYFGMLAAGLVWTYANHFHNSFHFDDFHTVTDNAAIRSLSQPLTFFTDRTAFSVLTTHQVFRPLVTLSLAVDYAMAGGYDPFWFHVTSFVWFLALVLVLQRLFARLLGAEPWGWFAAALFTFHPVVAETVNYIVQRGDIAATLGLAGGLALYLAWPRGRVTGLYLAPVALGALAKATALVFPLLLLWYFVVYERRDLKRTLLRLAPSLALVIVLGVWIARMTGAGYVPGTIPAGLYLATQPVVASHYVHQFFVPSELSADTDWQAVVSYSDPRVFGGLLFVAILAAFTFWTMRREPWRDVAFGLGWFLIALVPTAVTPLAEVTNDHRMFMAFPGLCLAVTRVAKNVLGARLDRPAWRWPAIAAALLIVIAAAWGTRQRNEVWRTEETLWRDVTIKSPRNGRGLMNYGLSLMARGEIATALSYFERAAEFNPNYNVLEINRGIAKGALGRSAEAEPHFRRAIQLSPDQSSGYFYYARWLHAGNRRPEASQHLTRAIQLNPKDMQARALLAKVFAEMQQWKELGDLNDETLRVDPGDQTAIHYQQVISEARRRSSNLTAAARQERTPEAYLELSLAHFQAGRYMDCVHAASEALRLRPDYAEAYNNIAAGYNALHRWKDGAEAAAQAVRLRPNWELAQNNRAFALQQLEAGSVSK